MQNSPPRQGTYEFSQTEPGITYAAARRMGEGPIIGEKQASSKSDNLRVIPSMQSNSRVRRSTIPGFAAPKGFESC